MAHKVVMAQLSPTMEEGRLVAWKVAEGDEVAQGDVVAEIETDKANMDVEAMGSGVLRKILVEEGRTVPVGSLIGIIADPDEAIDDLLAEAGAGAAGEGEEAAGEGEEAGAGAAPAEEEAPSGAGEAGSDTARAAEGVSETGTAGGAPSPAGDGRVRASPVARKMAAEAGLPLERLAGSGPSGRVVKRDVEEALASGGAAARGVGVGAGAAAGPARLVEETLEPSQMRKAIARRLVRSLGPVPHFFLTTEIDMERLLELRAGLNAELASGSVAVVSRDGASGATEAGGRPDGRGEGSAGEGSAGEGSAGEGSAGESPLKIGVNDLLLKAAAEALVRHPGVNASWTEEGIRRHGSVDLGIAVALEEGLITPVLRNAERKGLEAVAREARELIARARARELKPEEYQGATFSISNLGMFAIDEFTAVINPPEAAILAVGRTAEKPVVVEGEVRVRRRMRVTMSCDHRVVDGAMGARFLETFRGMLENPLAMVL